MWGSVIQPVARYLARRTLWAIQLAIFTVASVLAFLLDFLLCFGRTAGVRPTVRLVLEFSRLPRLGARDQIREVAVEDLLGRNPVRLEEDQIRGTLEGKVVLVTGAAGSIGSELCRQIARFQPAGIVGFEIAESPLFEIDREMRQTFPADALLPRNRQHPESRSPGRGPAPVLAVGRLSRRRLQARPPDGERTSLRPIENNVFGTYNVAVAAAEHGVEDFVMISSDKAVRPTNVMGATKRIAELLLLALQNGRTKYVAVRFGNVLGSNGSVIPIFKKQIAAAAR